MSRITRRQVLRSGAVAIGVGVAGCGGGGDGGSTGSGPANTTASDPSPDWPTFQYDNRNTGFNPTATGPAETPSPVWQREDYFEAHPIVVDGIVYIGGKSSVQALDAETGETQWTYEVGAKVRSAPAYADGTVVFNGWDGVIYAVSADDGSEEWVRTKSKVANGSFDSFEFDPFLESGAVTIANGTVYNAGYVDRRDAFWALDLETGETEFAIDATPGDDDNPWHTSDDAPETMTFLSAPAISDGMAYVVDNSGWVYAIDIEAGSVAWSSYPSDDGGGHNSATVQDGTVYFANASLNSSEQALYALDASNGEVEWRYPIESQMEASPTVAHGAVFIGDKKGTFYAVETDGTERWTFDAGSPVMSAASAGSEQVYVGTWANPILYAIDPETGDEVWSVSGSTTGRDIDTPPVVHEDTVYLNAELGPLVAFR